MHDPASQVLGKGASSDLTSKMFCVVRRNGFLPTTICGLFDVWPNNNLWVRLFYKPSNYKWHNRLSYLRKRSLGPPSNLEEDERPLDDLGLMSGPGWHCHCMHACDDRRWLDILEIATCLPTLLCWTTLWCTYHMLHYYVSKVWCIWC